MKRIFLNSQTNEEATVSQETDAVTVTRREVGTRSKGKPTRIPLKRCQGESVEQEARVQELKLQAAGFTFDRDDGAAASNAGGPFIYISIGPEQSKEVVEWATGGSLPQGVVIRPVGRNCYALRDAHNGEIRVSLSEAGVTVVPSNSPLAAVAYLLGDRGLATVYAELPTAPNKTQVLTPAVRTGLLRNLPEDSQAFLEEAGLATPGVVKTTSILPAVLL